MAKAGVPSFIGQKRAVFGVFEHILDSKTINMNMATDIGHLARNLTSLAMCPR